MCLTEHTHLELKIILSTKSGEKWIQQSNVRQYLSNND